MAWRGPPHWSYLLSKSKTDARGRLVNIYSVPDKSISSSALFKSVPKKSFGVVKYHIRLWNADNTHKITNFTHPLKPWSGLFKSFHFIGRIIRLVCFSNITSQFIPAKIYLIQYCCKTPVFDTIRYLILIVSKLYLVVRYTQS